MAQKRLTLCWKCTNMKCSWMRKDVPVPGWTAEATLIGAKSGLDKYKKIGSYNVVACPEFQSIKPQVKEPRKLDLSLLPDVQRV